MFCRFYQLLLILLFSCIVSNVAYCKQNVYYSPVPLAQIIKQLKEKNHEITRGQIIDHLKTNLKQVTPDMAREIFGIEWIDNALDYEYPDVIVSYIGEEVGYGLFALQDIEEEQPIAEYTGRKIQDKKDLDSLKDSSYVVSYSEETFDATDAQKYGNAARFASHIESREMLLAYGYKLSTKGKIAEANSGLALIRASTGNHIVCCFL
ncbi:exported hypothetical protein [Gammaproteobacteria bacterium]